MATWLGWQQKNGALDGMTTLMILQLFRASPTTARRRILGPLEQEQPASYFRNCSILRQAQWHMGIVRKRKANRRGVTGAID